MVRLGAKADAITSLHFKEIKISSTLAFCHAQNLYKNSKVAEYSLSDIYFP